MFRTLLSILIAAALIACLSVWEMHYVQTTFAEFHSILETLYDKTEAQNATSEDGDAVLTYWKTKKEILHIWLPHTALQEVDYQLNEAVGFLRTQDYPGALPKIETVLGISESIPKGYTFGIENVF